MRGEFTSAKRAAFIERFPLLMRFAVLLSMVIAGAAWWAHSLFGDSLPEPETVLFDAGLSAPVTVARDAQGVPHINASSDEDVFFAIGFVHAQDRLWQLELQRRTLRGELSEIFGKAAVPQDIWFRTLDLQSAAKSAWPSLSPNAQASLEKYAAGVNAGI